MREYSFAVATAASTFVLLVIGGMVHATGSSLACPDWPLCNGQVFPAMQGGVLFEHGHRLAALTVAVLTVSLAVLVWRSRRDATLRAVSAIAVVLVAFQAALGAITVLYELPLLVSSAHLATSMAFFACIIFLAHRLRPAELPRARPGPRVWIGVAAAATYAQIVLGGFVRHTGSGLACGNWIPLCRDVLWPAGSGPAQLHMVHRIAGVALAALIVAAVWRPTRDALRARFRLRAGLGLAAPALVLAQVGVGFWTVASGIDVHVVTCHVALAALLLADLLALFLSLGPARAPDRSSRRSATGRLVPA